MPWNVRAVQESSFLEVVFTGAVTPKELQAASKQSLSIAREKGLTRLLSDCSAFKGGHSVFDLFTLANDLKAESIALVLKQAIILPGNQEAADLVRFWETTCANRGILVRIFDDRQRAVDWLVEG
jgi:hypothetical protein